MNEPGTDKILYLSSKDIEAACPQLDSGSVFVYQVVYTILRVVEAQGK